MEEQKEFALLGDPHGALHGKYRETNSSFSPRDTHWIKKAHG